MLNIPAKEIEESARKILREFEGRRFAIWINFEPPHGLKDEVTTSYTAYVNPWDEVGLPSAFGYGVTASEAVDSLLKNAGDHDIKKLTEDKIRKLEVQLTNLKLSIGERVDPEDSES